MAGTNGESARGRGPDRGSWEPRSLARDSKRLQRIGTPQHGSWEARSGARCHKGWRRIGTPQRRLDLEGPLPQQHLWVPYLRHPHRDGRPQARVSVLAMRLPGAWLQILGLAVDSLLPCPRQALPHHPQVSLWP